MNKRESDLAEGSAPSEAKKQAAHEVSDRNVGAPATPGVMAHRGKEKNEENLWMMVRTSTNWNLIRELLGTSNLKEVVVVAVGE
jgi:hypothetical protein